MTDQGFYVQVAIWSQVISALLFIAVLVWLWFRFIQPTVLRAQDETNRQLAESERRRDEAKASLDLLGAEVEGAKRDAELIKERAAAQAKREFEASIAEANEAGERALRNSSGELDRALAAARDKLRGELLDRALLQAREDAGRRVDQPLNDALVDRFIAGLERNT